MLVTPYWMGEEEEEKGGGDGGGLVKRLLKTRSLLVSEVVTDKLARKVMAQLLILQEDDPKLPITVYVNSPGGSADSGFAIYDLLRYVKPPVRSVCSGLCASAAVLIYLAAKKERRFSLPHSRFLLHQPSTQLFGSASDVSINAEEIVRLRRRYNEIVSAETGRSVDQCTQDADRDFWLSSSQALEYGLVNKVITNFTEMEKG